MSISRKRAFWPSISCELRLKSRLPRVTNTSQFYHCILTQHLMGALVVAKVVYPGYFSLGSQFVTRSSQFITKYSWAMTYSAYQEHGKREGKTEFATGWKSLSLLTINNDYDCTRDSNRMGNTYRTPRLPNAGNVGKNTIWLSCKYLKGVKMSGKSKHGLNFSTEAEKDVF